MKYKVGETTVESDVGSAECYHLQLRRPFQEWDAFYDKGSGILIKLQETVRVGDYEIAYGIFIIDTNAHLSITAAEALDHTTFFILAAVVAVMVSLSFFALKKRRKSNLNMGKK